MFLSLIGRYSSSSSNCIRRIVTMEVEHDANKRQFFINLDNSKKAFLRYEKESLGVLNLYETFVPPSHEGRGIGKILAREAFEYCRRNELKMRLSCWYLRGFLERHPVEEYDKLVVSD